VTRHPQHARHPTPVLRQLLVIGPLSGVLYVVTCSAQRALSRDPGPGGTTAVYLQLVLYAAATLGLFGLYCWLLRLCKQGELRRLNVRVVALGLPMLFTGLFLLATPSLTIDTLSYISHGYISAELGQNPYEVPSRAVTKTPLGPELASYGWRPVHPVSPYGPVWTQVEAAVVRAADDVGTQIVVMKLIAAVFSLASAVLIWIILGRVSPDHQMFGTIAYLWNPLIIVELAGEGHNDALMVFFTLLALALTVRGQTTGSIAAMSLGALTKYLPLIFFPLQIMYLWRTRTNVRRLIRQLVMGTALSAGIAALTFAPVWTGAQTFAGVRMTGQLGHTGSTQTVLAELLSRVGLTSATSTIVSVVAVTTFAVFLVLKVRSVIDARHLLRASAWVAVFYVLLASPSYWPWYAVLPVALMALVSQGILLPLLVSLSIGARLVAPLDQMFVHEVIGRPTFLLTTWLGAVAMPLFVTTAFQFARSRIW
jgi:alpha-1,6-mannosyltransferase